MAAVRHLRFFCGVVGPTQTEYVYTDRQNRTTGGTCARDEETKKERQREKLGIRPDVRLRRHQIEKKISMRLLYGVMCHRNWLSGFGDVVGVEICHLPNAVTIGLYNSLYCRTCGHST